MGSCIFKNINVDNKFTGNYNSLDLSEKSLLAEQDGLMENFYTNPSKKTYIGLFHWKKST